MGSGESNNQSRWGFGTALVRVTGLVAVIAADNRAESHNSNAVVAIMGRNALCRRESCD